jgi:protein TonB
MNQSIDDILFENRNKEYGSYRLRKWYFRRLLISLMISVTCMTVLVVFYSWYLNSDGDETVYLYPSSYPNLKSAQGSLMNPEDLRAYLKSPETPKETETNNQTIRSKDVLHNFRVVEKATPDTLKPPVEDEELSAGGTGLGIESDSSIFGGYLLGEGEGGGIGSSLDKFPEFPGGTDAVRRYIELNVVYPLKAIKQKINGVVILSFDVNKQGEVDNIQVERGVNPMLDSEAIKAVSNMPRWKPGIRHGRPVVVKFVIPVRFMPIS